MNRVEKKKRYKKGKTKKESDISHIRKKVTDLIYVT